MANLQFNAQISCNLNIGKDLAEPNKPGISIPLSINIPVEKDKPQTYSYKARDEKLPVVLNVEDFIDWVVDTFGIDRAQLELPEEIIHLSVAIFEMTICTDGTYKIELEMGEQGSSNEWAPKGFDLTEKISFSNVKLVLENKFEAVAG